MCVSRRPCRRQTIQKQINELGMELARHRHILAGLQPGIRCPMCYREEIPILEAARRCGLVLNDRTLEWDEVEASCPFCDDCGPGKYHLSLNTRKNQYRCNLCEASGNSVSLYARINGTSFRQAYEVLSEDGGIYRFPQQPLSQNRLSRSQSPWPCGMMFTMICSPT